MRTLLLVVAASVILSEAGSAQVGSSSSVDSKSPSFEVASIKQNKSAGAGSYVGRQPGGRFSAQNASLVELILFAYEMQSFQLMGGPGWTGSDRWDIVAKLEDAPPAALSGGTDQALLALRTLLADRFKLVVHRETQQLPIYALVLARPDGRPGSGMNRSAIDCPAMMAAARRGGAGVPSGSPASGPPCGLRGRVDSVQSIGTPLSECADALSRRVQRTVVDRTGLAGTWDFTLTYTPEPSQIAPGALAPGSQLPAPDPNKPSLFTALQEQLGLKLESVRGPVEVLVIERVERPTED